MTDDETLVEADGESRIDRAIAEFLAAEDAGIVVEPRSLIARYPDLEPDLEVFFADRRRFQALVGPADRPAPGLARPGPGAIRPFGGYDLLEVVGRGGMGVVYKARQQSPDRLVALKMINAGSWADGDDLRRFRNEAEAVARLAHPNLLTILEVGEHEGCRYFTMPLMTGGSLAENLRRYRDDLRLVASLMADIAAAVHHAHQRGILHRDLKPANILLDEEGRPHVADFGLAKDLGGDGEPTHPGAILGTPAYMAPEQASGHQAATTASDVYGLGAILYAMITGRAAFAGDSPAETIRRVRDEQPERPTRLNPLVDRDLETICLKSLEKEAGRRYDSARALAADLARWLDGRPIAARPVGPVARARMWSRRNPALAGSIAALGLSVAVGAVGIVANWLEVRRQKDLLVATNLQYRKERDATRSLNEFLVNDLLGRSSPLGSTQRDVKVVDLLDRSAEAAGHRFPDRPDLEASIRQILADSYRALGDLGKADGQLAICLRLWGRLPETDQADRPEMWHSLAGLRLAQGQPAEAESLAARAFEARKRILGEADPATFDSALLQAVALRARGKLEAAEASLNQLIAAADRFLPTNHRSSLALQGTLAVMEFDRRDYDRAERRLRDLERKWDEVNGGSSVDMIIVKGNLGAVLLARGDAAGAERIIRATLDTARQVLGREHDLTLTTSNHLAAVLRKRNELAEAAALLEEVVQGRRRVLGGGHPETLRAEVSLAANLADQGHAADALRRLRPLLPALEKSLPPQDPARGTALVTVADSLRRAGPLADAEPVAAQAVAFFESLPDRPPRSAQALSIQAAVFLANGKLNEALAAARGALKVRLLEARPEPWKVAATKSLLGEIHARRREDTLARPLLLEARESLRNDPAAPRRVVEEATERVQRLLDPQEPR